MTLDFAFTLKRIHFAVLIELHRRIVSLETSATWLPADCLAFEDNTP